MEQIQIATASAAILKPASTRGPEIAATKAEITSKVAVLEKYSS